VASVALVTWPVGLAAAAEDGAATITPEELLDLISPVGGYSADHWERINGAIARALDADESGILETDHIDVTGDGALKAMRGDWREYVLATRKSRTEANPTIDDVLRSESMRSKWIPLLRDHMRQIVEDRALVPTDRDAQRERLRVVHWMLDFRTKLNPDGSLDKYKVR
jgi:hypothetical protein